MSEIRDVIIIGSGPAAWSCALTARQRDLSVTVAAADSATGWLQKAERIDNYPGLPQVSGKEMLRIFRQQAEDAGTQVIGALARQIIRCIRVVSEEKPDQAPVRMYVHPVLESPNYEPLHLVLQDQDKRSSLLKAALRDMVAFKAKYRELHELAKVMDAVDQTMPILEEMQ